MGSEEYWYLSIYNGEENRVGLAENDDIIVYENEIVSYTWLSIECVTNAVFIYLRSQMIQCNQLQLQQLSI